MRLSPASSCGTATAWPGWWLMMLRKGCCRFVQQPAEVEEVLLRRRPLLQRGIAPLGNEGVRRHADALSPGYDRLVVGISIEDLSCRTRNDGPVINGPDAVRERQAD